MLFLVDLISVSMSRKSRENVTIMDSPKLNEKSHRSHNSEDGPMKRTPSQFEHVDDLEASTSQILERVKSDRVAVTKPEEDWRRRTIIVEKKDNSFGFTLQSYGIHYKKEQEIEMITYVDYIEFDGPAYKAGMREGDVILSINGTDMEKADHKTLVNFIKQCDTRMRMVVLFEDCVRKVELHIRYIELQKSIQDKMSEYERLCIREQELLDGKWKTHSLPSQRKKNTNGDTRDITPEEDDSPYSCCRPTVSTEDVAAKPQKNSHVSITYQYFDPNHRAYVLQPSTSRNGDFVVSLGPPRSRSDHHHFIVKTPQSVNITTRHMPVGNGIHQGQQVQMAVGSKGSKKNSHQHSHRCNPCYPPQNNQDSTSLEAYDLASPCCDPHCVPSARRRSRHHKHHDKEHHHQKKEKARQQPERESIKRESSSQTRSKSHCHQANQQSTGRYRYLNFGAGIVSQCSLQSCTSSEVSVTVPTCESSVTSYTTSLSSDTLYWDNPGDARHSRTPPKMQNMNHHHHHQVYQPQYKPKSWDNLTTKAFGGYGFGYGYSDSSTKQGGNPKGHSRAHSTKSAQEHRSHRHSANEKQIQHGMYLQQHSQHRYTPPTKSTESLLLVSKYHDPNMSDSSISCECLDVVSPEATLKVSGRFFQRNQTNMATSPTDQRNTGYYSQHIPRPQLQNLRNHNLPSTCSEITRL